MGRRGFSLRPLSSARSTQSVNVQPPESAGVSPALRPGLPQPQDAGRMPALPGGVNVYPNRFEAKQEKT